MYPEREIRSTAFVICERRLITNAHCIQDASAIRVTKRCMEKRFKARVAHKGSECDLALLEVDDDTFWEGLVPCRLGEFPVLQDTVFVAGYPMGGSNICMTAGVVSRIDMHPYSYTRNMSELLAIQIDATINDGNSGGPAFNMYSEVVGVAFEAHSRRAKNGFIIPAQVVKHFTADCERNGRYTGVCEIRFRWQELMNAALKGYLGMRDGETGVLVRSVDKTGSAHGVLEAGDVVCAVDGVKLSDAGNVPFLGGPVIFEYLVKDKFVGDVVKMDIIRRSERISIEYALDSDKGRNLVPLYDCRPNPEYLIVAGMVFLTLTISYLEADFGQSWMDDAPKNLISFVGELKDEKNEEVVVLAQVLTADINDGYQKYIDLTVHEFNGQEVINLAHLAMLVASCTDEYFVFSMSSEVLISVQREKAIACLPAVLERHLISEAKHILEESTEAIGDVMSNDVLSVASNVSETEKKSTTHGQRGKAKWRRGVGQRNLNVS